MILELWSLFDGNSKIISVWAPSRRGLGPRRKIRSSSRSSYACRLPGQPVQEDPDRGPIFLHTSVAVMMQGRATSSARVWPFGGAASE